MGSVLRIRGFTEIERPTMAITGDGEAMFQFLWGRGSPNRFRAQPKWGISTDGNPNTLLRVLCGLLFNSVADANSSCGTIVTVIEPARIF